MAWQQVSEHFLKQFIFSRYHYFIRDFTETGFHTFCLGAENISEEGKGRGGGANVGATVCFSS